MTGEFAVLEAMMAWIGENRASLETRGLSVAVAPPRVGRPKQSVSLSVDSDHRVSQLIVWDTGEAELMLADARTDEDINEHWQIDSQAELDRALGDLLAWTSAEQEQFSQRWRALQHVTMRPGEIGQIARAALVLVLFEHKMIS